MATKAASVRRSAVSKTASNGGKGNGNGSKARTNGDARSEHALQELLRALTAARDGDFSVRLPARRGSVIGEIAAVYNQMADTNARMAKELVRVSRVIGREGRMTERMSLTAPGAWGTSRDSVNSLIDDLARPTTEVARVIEAVAEGDLSQKMALKIEGQPVKGEFLRIGTAVNSMVDQLSSFADEVTRVAREVGTEGKLGGQARVKGVSGTWKDLTDSVNFMASNLTGQVRNIAQVTTAVAQGDLTQKITVEAKGEVAALAETINTMVDQLSSFADEVTRVAREVGTEGKLGGQAEVRGVSGTWKDLTDNVNFMASNLTDQVRNIAQVATAVATGDLTKKITVEAKGEVAALAETINRMTDTLSSFADEVTRVAREVGTEGRLGGQAQVEGVAGTWKALTDNVNFLASNLTSQVRNIAQVTTAVARGDLTQKITVEAKGEVAALAETINGMTDTLGAFADEVTRVAREVGTEGILGGQAQVEGVAGTWKDLTDSVNFMAGNLTSQVRNIAYVATAVATGDLSQKITVEAKGEVAALAETINRMTDTLSSFADEVTRVAREVGTDGKLGGQAKVEGVAGTWKDLTDNVNFMASNLTDQVRNIAQVATAVARGDLSQKITVEAKGEVATLADTINSMTDTLSSFADEVTRVAREVGTDGKLGGQARVEGVAGTWKDLTDNVNFMASNLTDQVRSIAQVTTAVANGDLSQKITVDVKGEILELKNTINTMVDQLSSFADEVTRVAREVGTEGKLGGQAEVKGVSGTWKDLTDNVNFMASNLTDQVRNIAQVATAVARGDLAQKITVEAKGEVAALAETINSMTDTLSSFAAEVTRVAREVGTEGQLGGQAEVEGVAGTWKDLTDSVNFMASNLTDQVRNIAQVTTAVATGDLTQKITVDVKGEILELKNTINVMVDQLSSFADEVTRVAREVGTEGKLGGQAQVRGVSGTWKDLTDNVNFLASNLTSQVRNIAQVTTAVAKGDLTQKITVEAKGEVAALAETINGMTDQLSSFADEVTRVAREVGTDGKLGGQARVKGVSGTWKDLTDNVNFMAGNLTSQVRSIAQVTTAVAKGDLTKKITVDARGEILELKDTINTMVDQLSSFAAEVTRVAKEVGTEGRLGGQAEVEGVAGTWKRLTENVNQLAATLTTQLRAIAEVSTAVTQGDLTRSITVAAQGEVAELKDNINQMIANLRETTIANQEQDWLKTNLARISGLMQGQRDLQTVSRLIMSELTPVVSAQHGAFYMAQAENTDDAELNLLASYGYKSRKHISNQFKFGEALVGQAALEKKMIVITEAPSDYIKITSGLGESEPVNIIIVPVLFEDQVLAVIELASFRPFSEVHQTFLDQLTETIGVVLSTIIANMRTEELLEQSQRLTRELQSQSEELQTQQEELQQTNEELQEKAALLAEQNRNIEIKNAEIEMARLGLEEKAEQLALSSKYKSEFLANMSHELRTPLNSLLILAKLLSDNQEGNLSDKQIEFAGTIHKAGSDLLELINDILDLSKVEAGKMDITPADLALEDVRQYAAQAFVPVAEQKDLRFETEVVAGTPSPIFTDEQRLQQVVRNLLSNAFKFTERGKVTLRIARPAAGTRFLHDALQDAEHVVAFSVIDTGIGVPEDKLRLIFEAFQQADGTTARRYGGTGLGLSISREIARLLGGEIHAESVVGEGSTFTLYLPTTYRPEQQAGVATTVVESRPEPAKPKGKGKTKARATSKASGQTPAALPEDDLGDDRGSIKPGDRVILVAETDTDLAAQALAAARTRGLKVLAATSRESAHRLAQAFKLDAVILDTDLGTEDGIILLDSLKRHPATRLVPVHVIADAKQRQSALLAGAAGVIEKPVTDETLDLAIGRVADLLARDVKRLLVVEDDDRERDAISELLGGGADVVVSAVATGEEAFEQLAIESFDCVVLDLKLPGTSGFSMLEQLKKDDRFRNLPVIVYTGQELTRRDETRLKKYAQTVIIKTVGSPERLLDEATRFLHRSESALPVEQRRMLEQLHSADAVLDDKKILIVDDDVRNVFALTSALENHGMEVLFAENGRDGIEVLTNNADVDLVLMDIMMPEMDGYEAIAAVRKMRQFKRLPIIALTAKAMREDREKSIAAGASDYIAKPVEIDQLLSLMRVWLHE